MSAGVHKYKVFIDGRAGTTGLRIAERLLGRADLELLDIGDEQRKDVRARLANIALADVSILCLPDEGALEIVREAYGSGRAGARGAGNGAARIIDCSTAHRVSEGWLYGLPEIGFNGLPDIAGCGGGASGAWRAATRVANPGCHATGFLLAVRPLVLAGIIAQGAAVCYHSITGYSGGGKRMIADYEDSAAGDGPYAAPRQYGLAQAHKHLPEMTEYSGLAQPPVFVPVVADYHSGILGSLPLAGPGITVDAVYETLAAYYGGSPFVHVRAPGDEPVDGFLAANAMAGRDDAEIFVCGAEGRVTVVCRFDNLGMGASGAAIRNMNLMLGLPETEGLVLGD